MLCYSFLHISTYLTRRFSTYSTLPYRTVEGYDMSARVSGWTGPLFSIITINTLCYSITPLQCVVLTNYTGLCSMMSL
jgi:hypothetical protein